MMEEERSYREGAIRFGEAARAAGSSRTHRLGPLGRNGAPSAPNRTAAPNHTPSAFITSPPSAG
jgi:hypothetical protein